MGKHSLDWLFSGGDKPSSDPGGCLWMYLLSLIPFMVGVQNFGYETGVWLGIGFYVALFVILLLLRRR
jgi:hypothetical protein